MKKEQKILPVLKEKKTEKESSLEKKLQRLHLLIIK